jgi:hypothetical protein
MHHMRTINCIDRRHPIVQTEREVLVQKIGTLVGTVDGVDGEGGWSSGDLQSLRFLR